MRQQPCIKEFTFDGYSVPGGYYEIVVYQGGTEVERITEPTMQGAFDRLGRSGYKVL